MDDNSKQECLAEALENFRTAFESLVYWWDVNNNTEVIAEKYPFSEPLDEIEISDWIDSCLTKLNAKSSN